MRVRLGALPLAVHASTQQLVHRSTRTRRDETAGRFRTPHALPVPGRATPCSPLHATVSLSYSFAHDDGLQTGTPSQLRTRACQRGTADHAAPGNCAVQRLCDGHRAVFIPILTALRHTVHARSCATHREQHTHQHGYTRSDAQAFRASHHPDEHTHQSGNTDAFRPTSCRWHTCADHWQAA
jgi:hypothetical protein